MRDGIQDLELESKFLILITSDNFPYADYK